MKIVVLRVINSSRHRKCFVRGYVHSLFVSKALTRSYLAHKLNIYYGLKVVYVSQVGLRL